MKPAIMLIGGVVVVAGVVAGVAWQLSRIVILWKGTE